MTRRWKASRRAHQRPTVGSMSFYEAGGVRPDDDDAGHHAARRAHDGEPRRPWLSLNHLRCAPARDASRLIRAKR
jgi:hypothetical protein